MRKQIIWSIVLMLTCAGKGMAKLTEAEKIASHPHFKRWYPEWEPTFASILQENCSSEYQYYLNDEGVSPDCHSCGISPVVSCLLDNFPQAGNANMAAAGVVLGILPTILSLAGSTTVEHGILAMRRPLLAFFLSAGTPAVLPTRAFDYKDTGELLQMRPGSFRSPAPKEKDKIWATVITVVQYALALGAVANTWQNTWQLSSLGVQSFAPETQYTPMVWLILVLCIYIAGAVCVQLRMRFSDGSNDRTWRSHISHMFLQEFKLSGNQTHAKLELRNENQFFLLLSWFASISTVIHIIYGTLVFSSTLFISTQDATGVAGRYVGSVGLCRVILAYEFSGLRQTIDPSDAQIYVRMDQWYDMQKKREGSDEVKLLNASGTDQQELQPHVRVARKGTIALSSLCATA